MSSVLFMGNFVFFAGLSDAAHSSKFHVHLPTPCGSFRLTPSVLARAQRRDVRFVFTCITLLPFVLQMTKECRYSVHIAILGTGSDPKKKKKKKNPSQTSLERRPKCVAALLLSEVQRVFGSTGQPLDNSLHSEIPPLKAVPSQHNAGGAVVRSGQVILGGLYLHYPLVKVWRREAVCISAVAELHSPRKTCTVKRIS